MYKVIEILNQVENTSSTNQKQELFKLHKENELLQKVLEYTYNPFKVYGIGLKSINTDNVIPDLHNINCIFELLDKLAKSNINDRLKNKVNSFICSAEDERLMTLYQRMILKDLRLGMSAKSINKVWKGLIPEFNCMLAKKYEDRSDKIDKQEIIITTKMDGIRCIAIKEGDDVKLFTRQGKLIEGCEDIEVEMLSNLPDSVYDGELLKKNTENLNSKDLFQATRKETGKKGKKSDLEFHIFDMLPVEEFKAGESIEDCIDRKATLHEILFEKNLEFIKEVEVLAVTKDHSKIKPLLDKAISNGEEGLMINIAKGKDSKYQCKRSNSILKAKKFYTMDLKIIGIEEGEGRLKGTMGRVNVEYKGGIVGVGSGFTDEERKDFFCNREKYIGRIMEVNYFEITTNEKDGMESLRFPTYNSIREYNKEVSYH